MIDLHLHLDGSLAIEDFIYLAKKDNLTLPNDFPNCVKVPCDCRSLEEYLTRFDLPCSLMQSKENLEYVSESLVNRLYNLGYIYAEIRFASLLHTFKGLSQVEVIQSVLNGLKRGLEGKKDFDCNLIICLMENFDLKTNMESVEAAHIVNDPKIAAIDLAGPEGYQEMSYFKPCFDKAKEYGFNITIHAGEAKGNESILGAINNHAQRIGHGVHLSLDDETIKLVKDKNIYFEFCPTSNLQTTSLPRYESVPLIDFKNHGVKVTINSDNMSVSSTDVKEEFRHLYKVFKLSKEDVRYYLLNSIEASFTNNERKQKLIHLLDERIDDYYEKIVK